ncbi:sigma-70 family RNA polymerase sigma factor [Puniceicoccaceae bacterium K14]|nr:sigma-70 family RNA polymerase sigma factor [Puniceicoccaceae bacterium K14]
MPNSTRIDHFFRHEYGRLVSALSRRVGVQYLADIEDAVQTALATAIESWPVSGEPDTPSAWLYRVASNNLFGEFRKRANRDRILEENTLSIYSENESLDPNVFLEEEIKDDLLRMLFVCCDDIIPIESQLVLALKTLCGFDVREISLRLFISEANTYKRLTRARKKLRENSSRLTNLTERDFTARLSSVRKTLYILFTEGYLSSHTETAIRRELCNEAIRLTTLLAEHPIGRGPETYALLALMHLHYSRIGARQDSSSGSLILLEEQDRELWDQLSIKHGLHWLARSAEGNLFSRYHAEAGIAAEHCLAPSFNTTRWCKIEECYALLDKISPSAIHTLNRAVAVAEFKGPQAALDLLEDLEPPSWLIGSYQWAAVLSDLHKRNGNTELATTYRTKALKTAPTPAIRSLLKRRLQNGN